MECELNQKIWAAIASGRLLRRGVTYAEAQAVAKSYFKRTNVSACVITVDAAQRFSAAKAKH
jgi:hypothetical protein